MLIIYSNAVYEKYAHYYNKKFDHLVGSRSCKVWISNIKILCDLVCFTEKDMIDFVHCVGFGWDRGNLVDDMHTYFEKHSSDFPFLALKEIPTK